MGANWGGLGGQLGQSWDQVGRSGGALGWSWKPTWAVLGPTCRSEWQAWQVRPVWLTQVVELPGNASGHVLIFFIDVYMCVLNILLVHAVMYIYICISPLLGYPGGTPMEKKIGTGGLPPPGPPTVLRTKSSKIIKND